MVFRLSWGNGSYISFAIVNAAWSCSLPTMPPGSPCQELIEHAVGQATSLMLNLAPSIGVMALLRARALLIAFGLR